jgi:hypothetical protein
MQSFKNAKREMRFEMKTLLTIMILLGVNSAFAYDSAKMVTGSFVGQVVTKENVMLESVKADAVLDFCWGICADGGGKTKPIELKSAIASVPILIVFKAPKPAKFRASDLLGGFRSCAVRLTIRGKDAEGKSIAVSTNLSLATDKQSCAAGVATPQTKWLELKSYELSDGTKVYYLI